MGVVGESLKFTIFNIRNKSLSVRAASEHAVKAAGVILRDATLKNLSATDYTLPQLAALDHPYAQRHGSIQVNSSGGSGFLSDPRNRIHNRSGRLKRSLKSRFRLTGAKGIPVYRLRFDRRIAQHATHVIQGTNVLLPRDVIWDTAHAPKTRVAMMKAVVRVLGKELRSQASVRFEGVGTNLGGAL